ncbi:MAG: hypothetical protein KDB27_28105 [Planctomycetales bacterium]|nr:hypothetical protein [Planctomycetales bacterium]
MLRILIALPALLVFTSTCLGQVRDSGIDRTTFADGTRIQDDFYKAVNGKWLDETEIPSDKSNYGAFTVLADLSEKRIREIIETAAEKESVEGSDAQKVGDLYKSFMDEDRTNALGWKPIADELAKIDAISDHKDLVKYFGYCQVRGIGTPIGMYIAPDSKNSTEYIVYVVQSGTSLPDRDYYLDDNPRFKDAQKALVSFVDKLFALCELDASGVGDEILALETKLAEVQWERTKLRDADKRYNKFSQVDLGKLMPHFDWQDYLATAEISYDGDLIVTSPSFFEGLDKIFHETSVDAWKRYLKFNLMDSTSSFLSQEFIDASFNFHEKALAGVPELRPRWKRGVATVEGSLGEVVGRLYVEQYFPPEMKARMEELVDNLIKAFDVSIDELPWMTDATKARAKEKLSKFTVKIGYPNVWKDYSNLKIDPNDLIGNIKRSVRVEHEREVNKLGKPIDREEWGMTPQTVNAYYNPTKNEIVFPAAILQPPFFNMEADDAVNYGAIGAVIGHEISHGFDDQGSKYDGDGNLKSWWTPEDRHAFEALTRKLVDQFNEYSPLPGENVNGQLTLGENIADLSGLSIAHKAYRLSLKGQNAPVVDEWTGDQRFFLGWSQVWRRKYRDAEMIRRLKSDPHAPSWYRANGPVINIDAFYEAFNVKPTDRLFRPENERIRIW